MKRNNLIPVVITSFLISASLFSQNKAQAIRDELKTKPDSLIGKVYARLFSEFYFHSLFDSAMSVSFEAIDKSKTLHDKKFESTALIWAGMVEFEKGNYDKTVALYIDALKIKEEIKDVKGESIVLLNLAGVYYERNNYDKATEIYQKALAIKIKLNDKKGQSIVYSNLGNIAQSEKKYNDAINYYTNSKKLAEEAKDTLDFSIANRTLANSYLSIHKLSEAEKYSKEAYAILKRNNDRHFTQCLILLGKIYFEKKNYNQSIDYSLQAYNISLKNKTPFSIKEACLTLVKAYEKLNQFDKSLTYQKLYSQVNDSLQSAKMGEQLADMQVKYETEKKEKEIEHLDKENSKKELELTKKKNQILIISGISICILAVLLALYFYNNAKKHKQIVLKEKELSLLKEQKQKEIIETIITTEEKERKKIASDLHDGLGQILTAAKINLVNINEGKLNNEKLKSVTELVNTALQESKAMALNLMPLTLKENGLTDSIKNICAKYNKPGVQEISFNAYNLPNQLEALVEINTYRICQELLNNAVKYSQAKRVFLQLFCRDNKLIIQIEDNGIGFDKDKIKQDGLGMNTLKERVALLNGEIEIDAAPEKGANIFIELSL
jgi:signal transduction histidine kinase